MNFTLARRFSLLSLALSLNMAIALGLTSQPLLAIVAVIQFALSLGCVSWIMATATVEFRPNPLADLRQAPLPRIEPSMI